MMSDTQVKLDCLTFFANGKRITEARPDPKATLLQYLRRKLCLAGTKEGCGQGGCGSCTVMVSRYDATNKRIHKHDRKAGWSFKFPDAPSRARYYAVNACLFPLCAAHGLAITTVEGVGNPVTGLHDIQQRLVESYGLQCGFCTPGFVMSAFALLRNNPTPSREQVERAIEGNLCRCTGYRPILDALLTFSEESCPLGDACCQKSTENVKNEEVKKDVDVSTEESQMPIFPPELQLHDEYFTKDESFTDGSYTWYRPVYLQRLLELKQKFPLAPVIMGNTTTARGVAEGVYDEERVLIYGANIPELKSVHVTNGKLVVGGACTISDLSENLENISYKLPDNQRKHIQTIQDMVSRYGSEQIRNVASVAGSVMCGRSNSDIKTLVQALRATVTVASCERSRNVPLTDLSIERYEVITSVEIPISSSDEHSAFYKQADRRTFSLAIVNAGMFAKVNAENRVTNLRICFGGIFKDARMMNEISKTSNGRLWDERLLHDVLAALPDVLSVDNTQEVDSYKLAVASALWFKFFNEVRADLQLCEKDVDLLRPVSLPAYSSKRIYDDCTTEGQSANDPLGRAIPATHSEVAVAGDAIYVDDLPPQPNELFVALVLSSKARAKVLSVDTSKALAVSGVHGYIDNTDIPGRNRFGAVIPDQELFSSGEVMSVGQPICGIIAESREIAQMAAAMVTVEYEEMTPILTIQEAIAKQSFYGKPMVLVDGNVERGLAESEHVLSGEYQTGLQAHFYMETQSALVVPGENQELEVNCASQNLSKVQGGVSDLLNIPQHKITCKVKRLGGSFGGKDMQTMFVVGAAAVASVKTRKSVRCVLPRSTDMQAIGKRHPFLGKYKKVSEDIPNSSKALLHDHLNVGFDNNGKIRAIYLKLYSNGGYSLDLSALIMDFALISFESGYKVNDVKVEGYVCKTNTPSNTAFRGFGHPQAVLVMEDIIFQIANKLNITSEKVREVNFYQEGDVTPYGVKLEKCTLQELWHTCKSESKYDYRLEEVKNFNSENRWKKRGISMTTAKYGIGFGPVFLNQGAALVNIYTDGSVLVAHGGIEMGQGIHTKIIQIASSVLDVPAQLVHTIGSDTRHVPNTITTAGSMGTDIYGPAVKIACETLKERLRPLKESMPDAPWNVLISTAFFKRIQLSATGFQRPPKEEDFNMEKKVGTPYDYFTYGVACTEVEIDVLTGENQVLKSDLFVDLGRSLNPAIDIGQVEGAFMQGLGMVTSESMEIDEKGKTNNCSPLTYKIPNIKSIPREFNVHLIKNHDIVTNIYSSKSVGEPPLILALSVIAAIKEAVLDARAQIGKHGYFRLDSPATVQRIQKACGEQMKI